MVIKLKNKAALRELKVRLAETQWEIRESEKKSNALREQIFKQAESLRHDRYELGKARIEMINERHARFSSRNLDEDDEESSDLVKITGLESLVANKTNELNSNVAKCNAIFDRIDLLFDKESMILDMIAMQMKSS